tara:strand:- start:1542 stop:1679 length:138 start_codon:yes stop_codon:yes gene_type:complete
MVVKNFSIMLAVDCAFVEADPLLSDIMSVLTHEGYDILAGGCINE